MKLFIKTILFLSVFAFSACSSLSNHPQAYVENFDDFTSLEINENIFWKKKIRCGDYELSLGWVKNKIKEFTIAGMGKQDGKVSQAGKFYKKGSELFDVVFTNDVDGFVSHNENSSISIRDNTIMVTINGIEIPINEDDEKSPLVIIKSPLSVQLENISTYMDKKGNTNKLLMNRATGAKLMVNDQLYAVIDYYQNPAQIRFNNAFSQTLSQANKDFLQALMLSVYFYESSFSDTSWDDASTSVNIF